MSPTSIEWTLKLAGYIGETWNPLSGCDRCSPGCDFCYALTHAARLKRMGQPKYQLDGDPRTSGPGFALTLHPDTLGIPLRWRKPRLIFVNSMSDLWHPGVPDDYIDAVFAVAALAPQHIFQILTKRSKRLADWSRYNFLSEGRSTLVAAAAGQVSRDHLSMPVVWESRAALQRKVKGYDRRPWPGWPLPNVWQGVSIESDRYTFRADHLRQVDAAVRFVSMEPLLGPTPSLDLRGIHWVIVGGESGRGARPMHPEWVRDIRDRCNAGVPCEDCNGSGADVIEYAAPAAEFGRSEWDVAPCGTCEGSGIRRVNFFFKQWGAHRPMRLDEMGGTRTPVPVTGDPDAEPFDGFLDNERLREMIAAGGAGSRPCPMLRMSKKAAGRLLDGRTWDEMPAPAAA